jgi:hypothetical protein
MLDWGTSTCLPVDAVWMRTGTCRSTLVAAVQNGGYRHGARRRRVNCTEEEEDDLFFFPSRSGISGRVRWAAHWAGLLGHSEVSSFLSFFVMFSFPFSLFSVLGLFYLNLYSFFVGF